MGPVATMLLLGIVGILCYKASFLSMKAFRRLKPGNLINILFFYLIIFTASGTQTETGPTSPSSNWPTPRKTKAKTLRPIPAAAAQRNDRGDERSKGLADPASGGKGKDKNRGMTSGVGKASRSTVKRKQKDLDPITEQSLSEKKKERSGAMGILPGSFRRTRKGKESVSFGESAPTDTEADANRGDRGNLLIAAANEKARNQAKHLSIGSGMYSLVTSPRDLWRKKEKKGEPTDLLSNIATEVTTTALNSPSKSLLPAPVNESAQASASGSYSEWVSDRVGSDSISANLATRSVETNGLGGLEGSEIENSRRGSDGSRNGRVSFTQPDRTPGKTTPERQRTDSLAVGRRPFSDGGVPSSGPFPPIASQAPEDTERLPNSGANNLAGVNGRVRRAATEGALQSQERNMIFPSEEGGKPKSAPMEMKSSLQRFLSRNHL